MRAHGFRRSGRRSRLPHPAAVDIEDLHTNRHGCRQHELHLRSIEEWIRPGAAVGRTAGTDRSGPQREASKMKFALTGATGFIGSHILTELVSHGHDVTALVRDEKQTATVADRGAKAAVVDLYDRPAVIKAFK